MGNAFAAVPCQQAYGMLNEQQRNLSQVSKQHRRAATGDAFGVLLLGLPVSSITGGYVAGDVAASKGKINALEARLATC